MLSGSRIVWYRSGKMLQFGGGERVLLEGLRCLGELGADVRLLLNEPVHSATGAFFSAHHSKVSALDGFSFDDDVAAQRTRREGAARDDAVRDDDAAAQRTLRDGATAPRFVPRVRMLRRTLAALRPDVIIAESPVECRYLWLYSLGGRIALPPVVTFMHASPFQFADDATKYALAFRRHFADIHAADPVYRETIPAQQLPMTTAQRARLEAECVALRAGVRMSRLAFVLSDKNRREVERLYGIDRVSVHCPGGFRRAALDAAPIATPMPAALPDAFAGLRGPVLLSVCRLIAKKRVDVLLRALAALVRRNARSTATLVVVGEGPQRPGLEQLAAALGIGERVRFAGFVPEAELSACYGAADVFVSADNADYDLSVMTMLPHGGRIVVSTQYEIPSGLSSLRRFFTQCAPNAEAFATAIERALQTPVVPLNDGDRHELEGLCWESYFFGIAGAIGRAIGRWESALHAPALPHAPDAAAAAAPSTVPAAAGGPVRRDTRAAA